MVGILSLLILLLLRSTYFGIPLLFFLSRSRFVIFLYLYFKTLFLFSHSFYTHFFNSSIFCSLSCVYLVPLLLMSRMRSYIQQFTIKPQYFYFLNSLVCEHNRFGRKEGKRDAKANLMPLLYFFSVNNNNKNNNSIVHCSHNFEAHVTT